jgi:SAM-dependent methyltransferase
LNVEPGLDSYKRLCTEFYDLDKPAAPPDALEFYWRRYEAAGGPALEPMCGSGRFLVPFAERGADIDGVDASPEMLAACRDKAASRGLAPGLYLQFLQDLTLPRKYRFVFVPASFVLIPCEDQQASLNRLAEHLLPDGQLVIEMLTRDEGDASAGQPERRVTRADGSEIVLTVDGSGLYRYDLVKDGAVVASEFERYPWCTRTHADFLAMLTASGFTAVESFRPYRDDAATDGDRVIVYVCTR